MRPAADVVTYSAIIVERVVQPADSLIVVYYGVLLLFLLRLLYSILKELSENKHHMKRGPCALCITTRSLV
jgi:hypothetical protein